MQRKLEGIITELEGRRREREKEREREREREREGGGSFLLVGNLHKTSVG